MPIDAFLFGGRRATVVPLVQEAFDWEHAVFMGATMSSETTAAAAGAVGQLRFDPMAMLPFCGYNMADYFAHWLKAGEREGAELPRVFYVNWFRKDADGKFLWPGFGENSRVLEWVFRRCEGAADAVETPIGLLPAEGAIDTEGLNISARGDGRAAQRRHRAGQGSSCRRSRSTWRKFGEKLPDADHRPARGARRAPRASGRRRRWRSGSASTSSRSTAVAETLRGRARRALPGARSTPPREVDDCRGPSGEIEPERLAARFAAKEATIKALPGGGEEMRADRRSRCAGSPPGEVRLELSGRAAERRPRRPGSPSSRSASPTRASFAAAAVVVA